MMEVRVSASIIRRRSLPGPRMWVWPTIWSSERGRTRAGSGATREKACSLLGAQRSLIREVYGVERAAHTVNGLKHAEMTIFSEVEWNTRFVIANISGMLSVFWVILGLFVLLLMLGLGGAAYGRRWRPALSWFDGVLYLFGFAYARGVHDLKVEIEPGALDDLGGPMVVVCNHTAGVDPILVSLSVPTKICWLMAEDMRLRGINWLWDRLGVIFIARNRHGRTGLRRARNHLSSGGVIGIFPEGKIERPRGRLLPFASGVGVLVQRSGARVLPVIIEGTPCSASNAWESLWMRSETRVRVMKPIDYKGSDLSNAEIAQDLHGRYERWTGQDGSVPAQGAEIAVLKAVSATA